jgi:hypothetical protein
VGWLPAVNPISRHTSLNWGAVSRSSDSDVPPSPESADEHVSIIPGPDPVPPDPEDQTPASDPVPPNQQDRASASDPDPVDQRDQASALDPVPDPQDQALSADMAPSGDPGRRRRRRGRMLIAAGSGVALLALVGLAILALSHQSGQPSSASIGPEQAMTGTGQPGDTASQSLLLLPASQAGAPSSAPTGVTATGQGGPSAAPSAHPGNAHGTSAAGATKPATTGTGSAATGIPASRTQAAPVNPRTSGELPPLAEPPAKPTNSPNAVPPVTADRAVTVSAGPAIQAATNTCASGTVCYSFRVSVANFPANVALAYSCADGGGVWWGPGTQINSGTNVTNSSGDASFITYCTHPSDGATVTIDVGGGGLSASGSFAT